MISKDLTVYFDELRIKRGGISQLDLIEGITSATQFRRYLNGKSKLPFRVIVAFSERLGLKYDYVLDNLDITKNKERSFITRLMNTTVTYNFKEFDEILKELDTTIFIQSENKLLFDYIIVLNDLFRDQITKDLALYKLKKLINYPEILVLKEMLSVAEFMILGEVTTLLPVDETKPALDKLKMILENPKDVIADNNEKLVIMLLVRIIKTLGISAEFKEALSYCLAGIKICKATHTLYSLDYLYYYAALCYDKLGDTIKRDEMIFSTIMAAYVEGDPHNAKKFVTLIEDDFDIKVPDFVKFRL